MPLQLHQILALARNKLKYLPAAPRVHPNDLYVTECKKGQSLAQAEHTAHHSWVKGPKWLLLPEVDTSLGNFNWIRSKSPREPYPSRVRIQLTNTPYPSHPLELYYAQEQRKREASSQQSERQGSEIQETVQEFAEERLGNGYKFFVMRSRGREEPEYLELTLASHCHEFWATVPFLLTTCPPSRVRAELRLQQKLFLVINGEWEKCQFSLVKKVSRFIKLTHSLE